MIERDGGRERVTKAGVFMTGYGDARTDANANANEFARPLKNFRVVDLADEHGELIGRLLADHGADVIRVEPPGGAASRTLPPLYADTSLYFAFRNAGKRCVRLDLESEEGRAKLHALLEDADALIESFAPGKLEALGLGADVLAARHRGLVITRFSAFGGFGPCRDWAATDAVLAAMSGMMFKAGLRAREPLLPPAALAGDSASVTAAFATLLALYQRDADGVGQVIDFSALLGAAQTTDWSYSNASISRVSGAPYEEVRNGSGPVYAIYKCKDGFVRLVVLSVRQWRAMWEWLGKPEAFADPYWEQFINRLINADALTASYEAHFKKLGMNEVSKEAQRRGIVCTPVLAPVEVLANEHLQSRKTFTALEVAPGVRGPCASGFVELDGVRMGPSARANSTQKTRGENVRAHTPRARTKPAAPLTGLRVLDFGIGGVGVECGRMLADYGAEVIKVESRAYPDFIRVITGSEMSPSFASSSRSKQSFGVNAKHPEGLALLHKLVAQADVVIENNSTGTMEKLGLGFARLQKLNPRLVMASSQLLGARGAWANWIGYGPSTQPLGGMVHLWNYEDAEAPAGGTAIFPDHLAGRVCAFAVLAALLRRRETGAGGHVEVAQIETVTGVLGAELLAAGLAQTQDAGAVTPVRARGNRNARGAPWGAYQCAGEEQWCVITVRDDADWRALVRALGEPAWARARELQTAAGRRRAQDALDENLRAWTRTRTREEVTEQLQAHGVPCGPMLTGGDQLEHPHFKAWAYGQEIHQPELLARFELEGPCFRASGMVPVVTKRAPQLGEHTREIAARLLALPKAEIARLLEAGALEEPAKT